MINLIVSIISLALVAMLAISGVYYFGDNMGTQAKRVDAAGAINGSEQIVGAVSYYRAEHAGAVPDEIEDLVTDGYLNNLPPGEWLFDEDALRMLMADQEKCFQVNKLYNGDPTIYYKDDPDGPVKGCFHDNAVDQSPITP